MKTYKNILGNLDYFSSIDKLADDFMPSKKPFDPYKNTWGRDVQKVLHVGPAQSKELNAKQLRELIHELKEKRLREKTMKEDLKEIKTLSRKFMNKPWSSVPGKYRKKYARMDFDGDGVPNYKDCYPFDYDRQAVSLGVTSKPTGPIYSGPNQNASRAPAKSTAPVITPVGTNRSGQTIYNIQRSDGSWTQTTNPNYGQSSSSSSTRSSGGSSGGTSSSTVYRTGLTGQQVSYDGGNTWSNVMIPGIGQAGAGSTPYFNVGDTITYQSGTVTTYQDVPDQEKYNQIYSDILSRKRKDPATLAEFGKRIAPHYNLFSEQQNVIEAQVQKKSKELGLLGIGSWDFLNAKAIQKASDVLKQKSEASAALFNKKQSDIFSAQDKELQTAAQSETESNPRAYTTSVASTSPSTRTVTVTAVSPTTVPKANLPSQISSSPVNFSSAPKTSKLSL